MGHPLQSLSFAERDNCRTTHMTPSASSRSALTSQANARETGRRPLVKGSPRPALYSARHAEGDSSLMVAKKGAVRATENVEPEKIFRCDHLSLSIDFRGPSSMSQYTRESIGGKGARQLRSGWQGERAAASARRTGRPATAISSRQQIRQEELCCYSQHRFPGSDTRSSPSSPPSRRSPGRRSSSWRVHG